jgi:tetratricopeptide (TPR) repeat protein
MHAGYTCGERWDAPDRQRAETVRTTDGIIALRNLQAQIESLEALDGSGRLAIPKRVDLIDLLALRGELLGRIADTQQAASRAELLVDDAPTEGLAWLSRARTHGTFHRFADALADLDQAERLGAPPESLLPERVLVLHHLGRSDEALTLARAAADRQPDFTSLATLAVLHAERDEPGAAEPCFDEAVVRYWRISPLPLALLDVQRGRMWLRQADYARARSWFVAALQRVPGMVPAQRYLTEIDTARRHGPDSTWIFHNDNDAAPLPRRQKTP